MLKAQNISKQYKRGAKSFFALENANITIEENKLIEIFGRSGSGKSTFLSVISGILAPTEGDVIFSTKEFEKNLYSMKDDELSILRNRYFGFIPQGQSAISSLSVIENVKLPSSIYKVLSETESEKKASELLERFGILDLKSAMPNELSGGELRRMSIARALINSPNIVFADEPTNDLDDDNTKIVLDFLKEISKTTSVILVTHENTAKNYADLIFNMQNGKLN